MFYINTVIYQYRFVNCENLFGEKAKIIFVGQKRLTRAKRGQTDLEGSRGPSNDPKWAKGPKGGKDGPNWGKFGQKGDI